MAKSEFRDGIALRYGWEPRHLPATCPCGQMFSISHALHFPKGSYTHMRHDAIRDNFAELMNEVCYDVEIEPHLQSLQGESFDHRTTTTEDEARLDIKANGLWETRFSKTNFDVKIFNPLAKSCTKSISDTYTFSESQKRLKYEQRIIEVKNSSFNPSVFACAGPTATRVMKRLAAKICEQKDASYADAIAYIRTKLSFALLRSSILCMRLQVDKNRS